MDSSPASAPPDTTLEQEIATLDRVLHRLVVTDDGKLTAVLDKLLPKLVRRLNDAPAVRTKVIDILSHISKRARPNPSIVLPCANLLAMCRDVPPTSFAFNFSLTFLEMGVPRLPAAEQGAVAAQISRGVSRLQRYSPPQNILLNLLLVVLEHLPLRFESAGGVAANELSKEDLAVVTDWFLDVCLYPGVLTREGSAYHGLSPAGLARLTTREKSWPAGLLTRRKLAVIRSLKSDLLTPAAAVTPAIAAACSTHHEVVKAAEDLLKSLSSSDRNGTLRQDVAVASVVLNLVLGGSGSPAPKVESAGSQAGAPATVKALSSARSPASSAVAVRALAWLEAECPEGTAARVPEAVRVSFHALFVGGASEVALPRAPGAPHHDRANAARLRAAGARLSAFVAARCNAAMLPMVGPLLLQAVQRVLTMNAASALGAVTGGSSSGGGGHSQENGESEAPAAGPSLLMQIQHAAMLEACYEAVASLAVRRPQLFAGDTSVPKLLFSELSAKEPSLRVKISAALGALKTAYRNAVDGNLTFEIWSLLWGAATSNEHRARLCAVEWACDLFDFQDVAARRLCVSLCDDKITAVRSAASRGLQPPSPSSTVSEGDKNKRIPSVSLKYPSFGSFVLGALRAEAVPAMARGDGAVPVSINELPPTALARALDFALECRQANSACSNGVSGGGEIDGMEDADEGIRRENDEAVGVFLSLIESTLASAPSATDGQHGHAQMVLLHRSAAVALQKLTAGDVADPGGSVPQEDESGEEVVPEVAGRSIPVKGVAAKFAARGSWLQQWLGHESSTEIREAFAETAGAAAVFMDPEKELVPLLRGMGHKLKLCTVPGAVGFSNRAVSSAHGAACAVGAILTRLSDANAEAGSSAASGSSVDKPAAGTNAWTTLSEDALPSALSSVADAIGHAVSLIHVAACGAAGRVGAAGPLPLRFADVDNDANAVDGAEVEGARSATTAAAAGQREGRGRGATVHAVFERLWAACKLGETTDASRRAEAAAEALGRCCRGARHVDGDNANGREMRARSDRKGSSARIRKTLLVLFEMAKNRKEEELQFAVGAAVADVARSGPLLVPAGKVLEDMRASAKTARREMKESSAPEEDGATIIDALDYVLYQVLYVLLEDHSPHVSGAAAVYLLALVQRCRGHIVLSAYLPDLQAAFTRKLTVRSEFVQEVAGKGLALVYQAASSESKQGLVDSLVDALSTGRRRAATAGAAQGGGVDVHGATHAGAALSEAGAGAYGEMCAVANDVGRPDLIYSFLSMASHHAAWTTRRGASFGLGAIVSQVSAGAFGEQLDRIVPRLFRYRFDPSTKTRTAMDQLWRSVIGSSGGSDGDFSSKEKEVIRAHLSAIVKDLLRALGGRKWRDRQSACAGLSDILRGRGWDELGPHLEQLWVMADRALDDIKESVAEAAVDFAKTLANVSVRLCDPYSFVPPHGSGEGTDVSAAAAAAAAAAARSDAAGQGPDALREEAGEARRTIGTMMQDLRTSEAEARARGEEGTTTTGGGGLASDGGRAAAADEIGRQVLERGLGGVTDGSERAQAGAGRVLGGGARAAGPTVDEIMRPGRAGVERQGPPPSAEAKEAAAGAVAVVLPWLLHKGILSRCKVSQGLAMRTLQRLVKVCNKEALMPHLAELVATLIEGLSALEPQALQYMQFHAETQLEMTQDQMERLRLSVSRAGPLQDALDQCYRHLDGAGVVVDLMPRLLGLLRSGTGLATRSASAYLVLSLCERAPMEVRRAAPRLLPTLTNTALSERSSTLRRTYSSALSSVARLAPAQGVSRLASRLAQLFREADPDFDKRQRRTLALLLGDLCRRAGGQLGAATASAVGAAATDVGVSNGGVGDGENGFTGSGWARILPVAFVARHDPDKPVADAFEEAWQEGLTQLQLGAAGQGEASRVRSAKDAVMLMLPAVLTEVSLALSSVSRVTKRQGCSGLKDLASTLGQALGEASSGRRLMRRVLSQIPGRTWEGKEELLEAVVALCVAGKGSAVTLEPFVWGEPVSDQSEQPTASAVSDANVSSRGVKRNWESEPREEDQDTDDTRGRKVASPVAGEDDNNEDEQDDNDDVEDAEGQVEEDAPPPIAEGTPVAHGGGSKASMPRSKEGGGESAGDEEDDSKNADGTEAAFQYEDRLGDLDDQKTADSETAGEYPQGDPDGDVPDGFHGDSSTVTMSMQTYHDTRTDAVLESGMASLDMEEDLAVPFGEIAALMLAQLRRKSTKFRRAAAVSLADLLNAFPECCVYDMVAPTLLDFAGIKEGGARPDHRKEDPIMQARAVGCLAAAWPRVLIASSGGSGRPGIGGGNTAASHSTMAGVTRAKAEDAMALRHETVCAVQRAYAASLTRTLSEAVRRKVWSVRVHIFHALAAIVGRSYVAPSTPTMDDDSTSGGRAITPALPPVLTGALLADVVQAIEVGAQDAKYSQVRAAAMTVVVTMTSRKELRLALTPHKEGLVGAARAATEDAEPRVALEGSKAAQNLSWWP